MHERSQDIDNRAISGYQRDGDHEQRSLDHAPRGVRAEYFREVMGVELAQTDTVLAVSEIEYREPIGPNGDVEVVIQQPKLDESSLSVEYNVENRGEVGATAETVRVAYDSDIESSRPIPSEWREAITDFHSGQRRTGSIRADPQQFQVSDTILYCRRTRQSVTSSGPLMEYHRESSRWTRAQT